VSAPVGMTINATTGLIAWTPTAGSPGQANVILQVYNPRGGHATQQFTVAVSGVNQAPAFDPLAVQFQGKEGQELTVVVHAQDPENDPLVYWADNLPPGAFFDTADHALTWLPGALTAGTYTNVRFYASDGLHQVSTSTTILIAPTPQQPNLLRPADRTV